MHTRKFTLDQLRFLAELVYERAEFFNLQEKSQQANFNYRLALEIFKYIDSTSGIYSADQRVKIETIKDKISK